MMTGIIEIIAGAIVGGLSIAIMVLIFIGKDLRKLSGLAQEVLNIKEDMNEIEKENRELRQSLAVSAESIRSLQQEATRFQGLFSELQKLGEMMGNLNAEIRLVNAATGRLEKGIEEIAADVDVMARVLNEHEIRISVQEREDSKRNG